MPCVNGAAREQELCPHYWKVVHVPAMKSLHAVPSVTAHMYVHLDFFECGYLIISMYDHSRDQMTHLDHSTVFPAVMTKTR